MPEYTPTTAEARNSMAQSWAKYAEHHPVKSRKDFEAGFENGAFEERLRVVEFIANNQEALKKYAGARMPDLLVFILTELKPDLEESEQR